MPTLEHTGVSRKIASDEERLRLKRILQGPSRRNSPAASSSAPPARAKAKRISRPT
jgi:Ribonuclease G/E